MAVTPIANTLVGVLLAAGVGSGVLVMTQEMVDQGEEMAHTTVMTSDLQACQGDLIYNAAFAGGRFTQSGAAATVAECKVTDGTVLTVKVSPNGREFTLVATSDEAPNYKVVSDSATGGGAETAPRA
ncbi:hypothetical protein NG697_12455 [Pseudarthrobacter sp. MDT3-26]|uniref:hypothetical protein n=1 Tax=Pseudarthrobacter raffinosi TaxID=2953651 RepID=UPI00208F6ED3|nr:hypothetical protein [Pseudarthrobacter sp. MDT3-26]MCO4263723.1 hypothetical protein [Pseudarthrobacter sp. MDT3-26]